MYPYYYHVRLFPGNYVLRKKTFMEKYLPQLHPFEKKRKHPKTADKVVVFDLDETIGCFSPIFDLWQIVLATQPAPHRREQIEPVFHNLLQLYPELFRPGIFSLLQFVYQKYREGCCYPIHVYTNNQCSSPFWVDMILSFVSHKICTSSFFASSSSSSAFTSSFSMSVFARPICAYTILGKRHERWRTSHEKCVPDFLRCSSANLPRNIEICFVDDQSHPLMRDHPFVFYIQPFPYYCPLTSHEIHRRFVQSTLSDQLLLSGIPRLEEEMLSSGRLAALSKTRSEAERQPVARTASPLRSEDLSEPADPSLKLYEQISEQMMEYMQQFFQSSNVVMPSPTANKKKKTAKNKKWRSMSNTASTARR